MKRFLSILSAAVAFCGCSAGRLSEAETFSNPVIGPNWPDPTIWYADGMFYSVATGITPICESSDLCTWKERRPYTLDRDALKRTQELGQRFWAPDMTRIGDRWMLYITCYNSAEDSRIAALSSTSPTGPWSFVGVVTDSRETGIRDTIDPEVVTDPSTGRVWLFFGSVGRIHRVELNREGTALAEGARYEHVAGADASTDRSRETVFEGSYLHFHKGWWYLFASKGQYWSHTYAVVVGRSRTLDGVFLDRDGRPLTDGLATPVISSEKGDRFFGPGHNGEIFTDATGQDYILYHCHDSNAESASVRYTLLQRIFWDRKGWPYVEGGRPVATDRKPVFRN